MHIPAKDRAQRPFFIYWAPGATHAPHHVPAEWADKNASHAITAELEVPVKGPDGIIVATHLADLQTLRRHKGSPNQPWETIVTGR